MAATNVQVFSGDVEISSNLTAPFITGLGYVATRTYTFNPTGNTSKYFLGWTTEEGMEIEINDNGFSHGSTQRFYITYSYDQTPYLSSVDVSDDKVYNFYYTKKNGRVYIWFNETRDSSGNNVNYTIRMKTLKNAINLTEPGAAETYEGTVIGVNNVSAFPAPILFKREGTVGIGTTNPKQMFEVDSTGYGLFSGRLGVGNVLTSAQNGGGQDIWSAGTSAKLVVRCANSETPDNTYANSRAYAGIAIVPGFDAADTTNMGLWGQASGENPVFYIQNQINNGQFGGAIALNPVGGNVGIGTTSPATVLDIAGERSFDGTTAVTIRGVASQFGRNQLRLIGRFESNNDTWSGSGGRNCIRFISQSSLGSAETNRWAIQSYPNGTNNDLGFVPGDGTSPSLMIRGSNGNVGIGTANPGNSSYAPGTSLHLFNGGGISSSFSGSILAASSKPRTSLLFQKYTASPNASAWGEVIGFISLNFMPYRSTRPWGVGMFCQRDSYNHDDQADMHFFVTNGGYNTDYDALIIDGTGGTQSSVTTNGSTVTSDDRLKTAETLITNALKSIKKLKPQIYAKHPFYQSFSDLKPNVKCESGLIVQDVWYDAPEFRHLVLKDHLAIPKNEKPNEPVPGDITVDPDYSDWGEKPASLNYIGLIPYIISSIKELCEEIPHRKISAPSELFSSVEQYHGLIVSKRGDISLSSRVKDKSVYGVISETQPMYTDNREIYVKSHGEEGGVWIINTSNLEAGDYVTTSNVPGYGQKQDSEFLTNYTVAKITTDCDFTQPMIPVKKHIQQIRDVKYWIFEHCVGISKELYDTLPEQDRCISTRDTYKLNGEPVAEDVPGAEVETSSQYCKIDRIEFKKEVPGLKVEVRQELVNVLDEHGQIQWEDDPSGATEKAYEIRYLDADGNITDEANHVYKAAFVGCTYHCG